MNIIPFHQLQNGMMVAMLIYSNFVPNVCCRVASIQFQFNMIFNSLEESFRLNLGVIKIRTLVEHYLIFPQNEMNIVY